MFTRNQHLTSDSINVGCLTYTKPTASHNLNCTKKEQEPPSTGSLENQPRSPSSHPRLLPNVHDSSGTHTGHKQPPYRFCTQATNKREIVLPSCTSSPIARSPNTWENFHSSPGWGCAGAPAPAGAPLAPLIITPPLGPVSLLLRNGA